MKGCVQSKGALTLKRALLSSLLVAGLCLMGFQASTASAAQEEIFCNEFVKALPLQQRETLVVAANWRARDCEEPADGVFRLLRIGGNGQPTSFGEKGIAQTVIPISNGVVSLFEQGARFILVTREGIAAFTQSGSVAFTYGRSGRFELSNDAVIRGAAPTTDGGVALLQQVGGNPVVTKVDQAGQIDASFGQNGVKLITGAPWPVGGGNLHSIGTDSSGRILVGGLVIDGGGPFDRRVGSARLLADGQLDATYGPADDGFALTERFACWNGGYIECEPSSFREMAVDADGTSRFAGIGWNWWTKGSSPFPIAAEFSPDGSASEVVSGGGQLENVSGFVGQHPLLVGQIDRNYNDSPFLYSVERAAGPNPTSPGWINSGRLSPGVQISRDAAFDPPSGEVVSVGYADGNHCDPDCRVERTAVITRIDAQTGAPAMSFGFQGGVFMTANSCPYGKSFGPAAPGLWTVCKVSPPTPSGEARFVSVRKRRPGLTFRVESGPPAQGIMGTAQTYRIVLPRVLKLRRGGLNGRVTVSEALDTTFPFEVETNGRVITIRSERPAWEPYPGTDYQEAATAFRITVAKGALKPLPRVIRKGVKKVDLSSSVTFTPAPDGLYSWNPSGWFGPNSATTKIRIVR